MNDLTSFDEIIGSSGDPKLAENRLQECLLQAEKLEDKSIFLQIKSQIALAQAMQRQFSAANHTLDEAEVLITPAYPLAKARLLLERGRVIMQSDPQMQFFQQSDNVEQVRALFKLSFDICEQEGFDAHAINAAHMLAIVAGTIDEKINWNKLALNKALNSINVDAKKWLAPLNNNLGQNFIEAQRYAEALTAFESALKYFEESAMTINVIFGKWQIAKTMRLLERFEDAMQLQISLVNEFKSLAASTLSSEMYKLLLGGVYEELALLHQNKAKYFARLAIAEFGNNLMLKQTEPERLDVLEKLMVEW